MWYKTVNPCLVFEINMIFTVTQNKIELSQICRDKKENVTEAYT